MLVSLSLLFCYKALGFLCFWDISSSFLVFWVPFWWWQPLADAEGAKKYGMIELLKSYGGSSYVSFSLVHACSLSFHRYLHLLLLLLLVLTTILFACSATMQSSFWKFLDHAVWCRFCTWGTFLKHMWIHKCLLLHELLWNGSKSMLNWRIFVVDNSLHRWIGICEFDVVNFCNTGFFFALMVLKVFQYI